MTDDVLAITLVIALPLLAGLWGRGHLRLRRQRLSHKQCPKCNGTEWQRIHRRLTDHLFGFGLNVRRYRCTNPECGTEILLKRY